MAIFNSYVKILQGSTLILLVLHFHHPNMAKSASGFCSSWRSKSPSSTSIAMSPQASAFCCPWVPTKTSFNILQQPMKHLSSKQFFFNIQTCDEVLDTFLRNKHSSSISKPFRPLASFGTAVSVLPSTDDQNPKICGQQEAWGRQPQHPWAPKTDQEGTAKYDIIWCRVQ